MSKPANVPGVARFLDRILEEFEVIAPELALRIVEDWHEVDGEIASSESISWEEARACVADKPSLQAHAPEFDRVWFGIYSGDGEFYLRVRLEAHSTPSLALFDLSGHGTLLQRVLELAHQAGFQLQRELASAHFDARFAG